MKKPNQTGFSIPDMLLVVVVIGGVVLAITYGLAVLLGKAKIVTPDSAKTTKTEKPKEKPADPYKDWKSYNNSTYGISFKYPSDWKIDEVVVQPPSEGLTKTEFAINVKRNVEEKYSATAIVEVLNQNFNEVIAVYDQMFTQAPASKVIKTTAPLKGKRSVQYAIGDPTGIKHYLFEASEKTYVLSSINEELNAQVDADYWTKFNKVFESMQFSP